MVLILVTWVGFVGFVYIFGAVGQPFVDVLDERSGEVLSARADRMARGMQYDEAADLYRSALNAGFQDEPLQRLYTLRDLMTVLEKAQYYDEAAQAARTALEIRWDYAHAFSTLYRILRETKQYDEALAMLRGHFDRAMAEGDDEQALMAKYNEGIILDESGHTADAIQSLRNCHDMKPAPRYALVLGEMYCKVGQPDDAKEWLDRVFDEGDANQKRRARSVLESCADPDSERPDQRNQDSR